MEDPFFRSYGASVPSSLTRFLSRALVYSTFPPVSVSDTVTCLISARSFSWQQSTSQSVLAVAATSHRPSRLSRRICLPEPSKDLDRHFRSAAEVTVCVTPSLKPVVQEY